MYLKLKANLIGRLVDWKTDRLINLELAARTYTLNAVRSTLTITNNYLISTNLIGESGNRGIGKLYKLLK